MSQAIGVLFLKQGSCIIWKKVRLYLYYTRLDHPQYGTVSVTASLRQQPVVVVVVAAAAVFFFLLLLSLLLLLLLVFFFCCCCCCCCWCFFFFFVVVVVVVVVVALVQLESTMHACSSRVRSWICKRVLQVNRIEKTQYPKLIDFRMPRWSAIYWILDLLGCQTPGVLPGQATQAACAKAATTN